MPTFRRRVSYGLRLCLFATVMFVLLIWAIGAYQGYQEVDEILHPTRNIFCCETPRDVGIEYDDLVLETQDGLQIKGWSLAPGREAVVIMAHGASGNRANLFPLAHTLVDAGYGVILLDLRAHGESDGTIFTRGWLDIWAAGNYAREHGAKHIGVYGFSLGANMVIQAAAESSWIEAVVADGPSPARLADYHVPGNVGGVLYAAYDVMYWWQLDVRSTETGGFALRSAHEAVEKLASRPLFLIAAGAEPSGFEANTVQSLYDRYAAAGGLGEMWIIDEVYHGGGFDHAPEIYSARVIAFFDRTLRADPQP
jgi:uncharacterized protein